MKTIGAIAVPISLQSLIASSLGLVDQMMIGQLGETSVAAVGMGGRLPFIYMMVLFGITSATSIYAAQFYGKKDLEHLNKVISTTLVLGIPIAILFMIATLLIPETIVGLFSKDPAVITEGAIYLRYVSIGFLPMLISLTYSGILRSCHHVRLPLVAGMISFVTNTVLNYILIFGVLGMPEMGVKGAALATGISRLLEMVILLGVLYIKKLPGAFNIRALMVFELDFTKAFFITGLPLLINEFLWSLGESIYTGIYGRLGTSEAAGMIITYPLQAFCISFFVGVSSAAGIMLGNKLGEKDEETAYTYAGNFVKIGILGSLLVAIIIVSLSSVYVSVYQVPQEVKDYANTLIFVFALVMFVKVSNMIIGGGILRSGGQTKLTLYLDMIGGWLIGIPLGLLTAFVFKLPIYYVYFFISLEEVFRLSVGLVWMRRRIWMKTIV